MKTFYERVPDTEPLRQGDILYPIPKPIISLKDLVVFENEQIIEEKNWLNLSKEEHSIIVPIKAVWAIVASQDCDASRQEDISLFLIDKFTQVIRQNLPEKVKKRIEFLKKQNRLNAGCFYLPADNELFSEPMAVEFHTVIQVVREDIVERISTLRKGRLNKVAYEHYRECIAQYFRRYPYNEWYPFSKEEFEGYKDEVKDPNEQHQITAYPWQE